MKKNKPQTYMRPDSGNVTAPVECICGVWHMSREKSDREILARSTAGHLLHYILKGKKDLTVNGRKYSLKTGDVVYYYEFEEVKSIVREDLDFISVSFLASGMSPFPLSKRFIHTKDTRLAAMFTGLFEKYNQPDSYIKKVECHNQLLRILENLIPETGNNETTSPGQHKLWPKIESWIRRERKYRPSIDDICTQFKVSPATVARACRAATGGMTPTRYFRAFRLEEAQALLRYSGMNISEIAQYLEYPRLHEFSREFSKYFGCPPSSFIEK